MPASIWAALKTIYRFASRQGFIDLEPEIMVRMDKLMEQIQRELAKAGKKTKANEEHQLDLWREQYKLWRKMNDQDLLKPKGHRHEI